MFGPGCKHVYLQLKVQWSNGGFQYKCAGSARLGLTRHVSADRQGFE